VSGARLRAALLAAPGTRALAAAYDRLVVALAVVAGGSIAFAFALIVADVTLRTLGLRPLAFTSAAVEYVLLYFTLFAAPYLVRRKGHAYVDALLARLSGLPRRVAECSVYLVCVATSLAFACVGFVLAFEAIRSGSIEERSIDVPSWVDYAPVGPVFVLVAIEFARYLLGFDSMYRDRAQAPESL
jgi:C4-dicarboxylate transporter, DctQ subunit